MGSTPLLLALALAACVAGASAGCYEFSSVSRSSWGARQPRAKTYLPDTPLPYVAVHHGATPSCTDSDSCKARVRSYQNHHMDEKGLDDIGYNFLISEHGRVYEGRGWDLEGAHVSGYNQVSLGVCFIGNFTDRLPSPEAMEAFEDLIECALARRRLSASYQLYGHQQATETTCPGTTLQQWVQEKARWVRIPDPHPPPTVVRRPQRKAKCPRFVPRIQWGAPSLGDRTPYEREAKRMVIVHDRHYYHTFENCTNTVNCSSLLRSMYKLADHDVHSNFLIGGDGRVYEGRGWDAQPSYPNDYRNWSLIVTFIGRFKRYLPTSSARVAFLELLECGVGKGKLTDDYWLLGDRQIEFNADCPGLALFNWLKTHLHWMSSRAGDPVTCPDIVSRSEWGARQPRELTPFPANEKLDFLVIHHGDTPPCSGRDACARRIRSYQDYHMDNRGWADIGYNFLISDDGDIYEGRGWDLQGAHARNFNGVSIGVCFIGNYTDHLPSQAALDALKALGKCGVKRGRLSGSYVLQMHRDLGNTECPGEAFAEWIKNQPRWEHIPDLDRPPVPRWRPRRTEGCPPIRLAQEYGGYELRILNRPLATEPLHLVMVEPNMLDRTCSSERDCNSIARAARDDCNFLIGEDGIVYEGMGWDQMPFLMYPSQRARGAHNTLHVCFVGNFTSEPTQDALSAFASLVNCGVNNTRIRPDYGLVFERAVASADQCAGEIRAALCAWTVAQPRWTATIPENMPQAQVPLPRPCLEPVEV